MPTDQQTKRVGITTTVPVEVVFAAGWAPVDLNNVFIGSDAAAAMVQEAEADGMPRNTCSWIKGIFAGVKRFGIEGVIGCVNGDCSNTQALMENFEIDGVRVIPFAYPHGRNARELQRSVELLCDAFGVSLDDAEEQKTRLDAVRAIALRIDELTCQSGKVTGKENHLWLVSCSDFGGDPDQFAGDAKEFCDEAAGRPDSDGGVRLGYVGVPPICPGIYDFVEGLGARVVFNEVQRQFAMPSATTSLVEQYRQYTYPYDIFGRVEDIQRQVALRRIDGVMHYVQSFCYRQIQDRILRRKLDVPVLTVEFDRPGDLDAAAQIRIEAFLEMLRSRRRE